MTRSARCLIAAVVCLLAACSEYPLTPGDYQVTAVAVDHDGCGLMPETLVGHPAFVYLDDPTFLTVILQSSRAGNMVHNGAGLQGNFAHNSGHLYGTQGASSVGGCAYRPVQAAEVTVTAPDHLMLAISDEHVERRGCTPAGDICTSAYKVQIERLPAP